MEQEVEQYRDVCMALCNKLMVALEENQEAANRFCNGEINKAYISVNDKVVEKVRQIRTKIKKL